MNLIYEATIVVIVIIIMVLFLMNPFEINTSLNLSFGQRALVVILSLIIWFMIGNLKKPLEWFSIEKLREIKKKLI